MFCQKDLDSRGTKLGNSLWAYWKDFSHNGRYSSMKFFIGQEWLWSVLKSHKRKAVIWTETVPYLGLPDSVCWKADSCPSVASRYTTAPLFLFYLVAVTLLRQSSSSVFLCPRTVQCSLLSPLSTPQSPGQFYMQPEQTRLFALSSSCLIICESAFWVRESVEEWGCSENSIKGRF